MKSMKQIADEFNAKPQPTRDTVLDLLADVIDDGRMLIHGTVKWIDCTAVGLASVCVLAAVAPFVLAVLAVQFGW